MLNVVNSITGQAKPYLYRGEDCMEVFCKTMNEMREEVFNVVNNPKDMENEPYEEEGKHLTAKRCFFVMVDLTLMLKQKQKLKTIAILQVNTEAQHIINAI